MTQGKEDLSLQAEHEPNNIFECNTLNLRYFPAIVSGSSVIDVNGLTIVVKLCRWIFVESAVIHVESNFIVKEFSHNNIVAYWQIKLFKSFDQVHIFFKKIYIYIFFFLFGSWMEVVCC